MGWFFMLATFTSTVPLLFTLNISEEPGKAFGTAISLDAQEVKRKSADIAAIKTIPLFIWWPPF